MARIMSSSDVKQRIQELARSIQQVSLHHPIGVLADAEAATPSSTAKGASLP
jgi:hypothetical protein